MGRISTERKIEVADVIPPLVDEESQAIVEYRKVNTKSNSGIVFNFQFVNKFLFSWRFIVCLHSD